MLDFRKSSFSELYGSVHLNGTFNLVNLVDSVVYFIELIMSHPTGRYRLVAFCVKNVSDCLGF